MEKAIFSKGKDHSSGQFWGNLKGMNAGKGKGTSQGTKGAPEKRSSGQWIPHSGGSASVHQVSGSDQSYYNNATMEGKDGPNEERNLGEEGPEEQWEDEDVLGEPNIRSTREVIRNRGAKVVWPPHTQSGVFLNIGS